MAVQESKRQYVAAGKAWIRSFGSSRESKAVRGSWWLFKRVKDSLKA